MINPTSFFKRSRISVAVILVLVLITGSCRNEETINPAKGKMSFSVSSAGLAPSNGRAKEKAKPEWVYVSVVDDKGNAKTYIKLNMIPFGDGYVSEDLELAVGHYQLTAFFVLDGKENLLYSTPREGSTLAPLVNDPLDIAFDIREDENTLVTPEVLALEEAAKPGDFGYGSFAFDVKRVTALILPETSENIVKVSYEIRNTLKTFKGEVIPSGSLVDLNEPNLLNTFIIDDVSHVDLIVWTEPKECSTQWSHSPYQKVYRLTTELIFNGQAFQLPSFDSNRWNPYYYRTSRGLGFFFSADPMKSYNVEVHVPDGVVADYCWMDRRYWNASGGETCNLSEDAYAQLQMDGAPVGRFRMENQSVCETSDLYVVDSYVAVNSDKGAFHEFFSWTIINGVAVPSCDVSSSSFGITFTQKERRAPSGE